MRENPTGAGKNEAVRLTCYHPMFCFNNFGDCEGAVLRSGIARGLLP
jgi:hypothetical protein